MVADKIGGRWQRAARVQLPANAMIGGFSELDGVACPGRHSCVAVGAYLDATAVDQAMAMTLPLP